MFRVDARAEASAVHAMLGVAVALPAPARRRLRRFGKVLGHKLRYVLRDSYSRVPLGLLDHHFHFCDFLVAVLLHG